MTDGVVYVIIDGETVEYLIADGVEEYLIGDGVEYLMVGDTVEYLIVGDTVEYFIDGTGVVMVTGAGVMWSGVLYLVMVGDAIKTGPGVEGFT